MAFHSFSGERGAIMPEIGRAHADFRIENMSAGMRHANKHEIFSIANRAARLIVTEIRIAARSRRRMSAASCRATHLNKK